MLLLGIDIDKEEFLYIDPLKQGLKLWFLISIIFTSIWFLYIDPLKQGLKLIEIF